MEENQERRVVNHFEAGSNCQVFNGRISGCVFAMPGSTVTQQLPPSACAPTAAEPSGEVEEEAEEMRLPEAEPVNTFAPTKNLKVLLQQEWFARLRTDSRYTEGWCEAFVDALMASEWGVVIAREWGHKAKRLSVRGNVVGTLAAASVLKGSDLSIARAVTQSNEKTVKTFAIYMGRGRRKPYCDWVCEYVKG